MRSPLNNGWWVWPFLYGLAIGCILTVLAESCMGGSPPRAGTLPAGSVSVDRSSIRLRAADLVSWEFGRCDSVRICTTTTVAHEWAHYWVMDADSVWHPATFYHADTVSIVVDTTAWPQDCER